MNSSINPARIPLLGNDIHTISADDMFLNMKIMINALNNFITLIHDDNVSQSLYKRFRYYSRFLLYKIV